MTANRTGQIAWLVALCMLAFGAAGLGTSHWMQRTGASEVIREYKAADSVPRIAFAGDVVPSAGLVRDFDASDSVLYLLDASTSRVITMQSSSGRWRETGSFGRRGGGPGEMVQPTGIALLPRQDRIVVADQARLHYFGLDGTYIGSRAPVLPCPLMNPRVAPAGAGLLLSGRCVRRDTIAAELVYVGQSDAAVSIAHDPLYTSDGHFGSALAAASLYSSGDQHGLFGGGTSGCIYQVNEASVRQPAVSRSCMTSRPRYAFVADPVFRAKARAMAAATPLAAGALTIPDALPFFMGRLNVGGRDVLLRPVTNDSVAFRDATSDADLLIAGLDGLLGCRAAGCLWLRNDTVPSVMLVRSSRIAALAGISVLRSP